ncbi:MAG: hypothetical protein KatS3mg054_0010 [Chloroflexus sp.]|nr:MAG: hypothetical protein KatS3mg054_0010 [Chloroflexus sp.]
MTEVYFCHPSACPEQAVTLLIEQGVLSRKTAIAVLNTLGRSMLDLPGVDALAYEVPIHVEPSPDKIRSVISKFLTEVKQSGRLPIVCNFNGLANALDYVVSAEYTELIRTGPRNVFENPSVGLEKYTCRTNKLGTLLSLMDAVSASKMSYVIVDTKISTSDSGAVVVDSVIGGSILTTLLNKSVRVGYIYPDLTHADQPLPTYTLTFNPIHFPYCFEFNHQHS